jgi:hypothetical protein
MREIRAEDACLANFIAKTGCIAQTNAGSQCPANLPLAYTCFDQVLPGCERMSVDKAVLSYACCPSISP